MTDFQTDGPVPETPIGAATQGYAATPPSWGSALGALREESSTLLAPTTRPQSMAGTLARNLALGGGDSDMFAGPLFTGMTQEQREEIPTLSADDVNERYAPLGPDGKRVKLTDKPLPEDVAQAVGKAKTDEITRDGILARFENAHSWPVNMAAGMAGFMLDPMNAATAFVPGFGEEAIAARLGGGFLARMTGRAVSGAAAGAASQAPLEALKFDPTGENGLRDAFRDMAFAAAGNAVFSAGFGAAGDILRRGAGRPVGEQIPGAEERPVAPGIPDAARSVVGADAVTKDAAMRSAVSEMVDGRQTDVEPIFNGQAPAVIAEAQQGIYRDGFAPGESDNDFRQTQEDVYEPKEAVEEEAPQGKVGAQEAPEGETPEAKAERESAQADPELAAAESALTPEQQATMLPEERAELEATQAGMTEAQQQAASYAEAAACLGGVPETEA